MAAKPCLVGREQEELLLADSLDSAAGGAGHLVVTSGGLGIGKTAVLASARHLAAERGFTVLIARGSYLERELPFGLAGRLFPEIGEEELEPRLLHRMLAQRAGQGPLAIIVDDVQWADQPSLHWLSTLPHRVEHLPVVVLAGLGTGEPGTDPQQLEELLAGSSRALPLGELTFPATQELLENRDDGYVTACRAHAGGNPLMLLALARVCGDRERPRVRDLSAPALLPTLNVRLRRISAGAPEIARVCAVLDAQATLDRVSALTGTEPSAIAETVAAMSRMGLITTSGETLRLAHPLLRATFQRELTITTRQDLHASAARLLATTGAPEDAVAEHLLSARPLHEPWAADTLASAARRALTLGRIHVAVGHFRRALAEPMPGDTRTALLAELGVAESHVDVPAAIRNLTEEHPRLNSLRVLMGDEGQSTVDLGDRRTATARARAVMETFPAGPDELHPYLRALDVLVRCGELAEAHEGADRAVVVSRRWQYRPGTGLALTVRSNAARRLGRPCAAAEDARAALDLLIGCGAARMSSPVLDAVTQLVLALLEMGEHDEAVAALEPDWVRDVPDVLAAPAFLAARNRLREPVISEEQLEAEVCSAREWGAPGPLGAALRAQGLAVGGTAGLTLLEESVAVLENSGAALERARSIAAQGRALHQLGRVGPARSALRTALDLAYECESPLLVKEIRQELAASGGRTRRRAVVAAGPAGLTESELRVAVLAAAGKMNREIAATLFVQLRTVEIHLTKVYRKLGIDGRDQLAFALRQPERIAS